MTLRTIAHQLLAEHGGDIDAAMAVVDQTLTDKELRKEFDAFVKAALLSELYDAFRSTRDSLRRSTAPSGPTDSPMMRYLAASEGSFMDWPIGRRRLKDFTKAELATHIALMSKRLDTELVDLEFYRLVHDALKSARSTVRAHLREADLRSIRKQAERRLEKLTVA